MKKWRKGEESKEEEKREKKHLNPSVSYLLKLASITVSWEQRTAC